MLSAMPVFDGTTRPADGVRSALGWVTAEVEAAIRPAGIDEIRFLRSKRELHVRRGTATVSVYFSGSKWNGTGHGIWLHRGMAIRDSRLGRWRRTQSPQVGEIDDFLDHVTPAPAGISVVWQPAGAVPNPFADHELVELPSIVLRDVLGAFETYAEPLTSVAAVPATHLTAANVSAFAELALALDRPRDAEEVIRVALRRRPILEDHLPAVAARLGVAVGAGGHGEQEGA